MECQHPVRARSGFFRQPHFYHIRKNSRCSQCAKSEVHLRIQLHLLWLLPKGEAEMEVPFLSISRIADIAWTVKKIIFEIQCSSISYREIKKRTLDYLSIGYQPVWILHDRIYNKEKLTSQEIFLQNHPHYFTNTTQPASVLIYDQLQIIHRNIRLYKGSKIPVHIHRVMSSSDLCSFPIHLQKRNSNLYFSNDLIDLGYKFPLLLKQWKEKEKQYRKSLKRAPRVAGKWIYLNLLEKVLSFSESP